MQSVASDSILHLPGFQVERLYTQNNLVLKTESKQQQRSLYTEMGFPHGDCNQRTTGNSGNSMQKHHFKQPKEQSTLK